MRTGHAGLSPFERLLTLIVQPEIIAKILAHLGSPAPQPYPPDPPLRARAPPVPSRLL
jgi:hypothetical protein